MNRVLNSDLEDTGLFLASFNPRPLHRHIISQLLDGTTDVEVVGSVSSRAAVGVEGTWAQKAALDAAVAAGAVVYVDWEGVRYQGLVLSEGGLEWSVASKGPQEDRKYKAMLSFYIDSQAAL